MKKIVIILISVMSCVFISCNTLKIEQNNIMSTFYKKGSKNGFNYEYTLKLNKDNSFFLSHKVHGANPQCKGQWKQSEDTIFLTCNEENEVSIMLSNGYMNEREYTLKVISNNKIKINNIILKRIE